MAIRSQDLSTIAPILATFAVKQTNDVDDLSDSDLGAPVTVSASNEVGPCSNGDLVLGKLIALTLSDNDHGRRLATVQIGGVCRFPVTTTYPVVGNRIVAGGNGTVRQAPALTGDDPAGGTIARGIVLAVNGTIDCVIYLN